MEEMAGLGGNREVGMLCLRSKSHILRPGSA